MDEKKRDTGKHELYEETTNPHNPPESVLDRTARTEWLLSSVGTLVVAFVLVAAAFGWVYVRHELGNEPQIYPDPKATGTSGELQPREGTPGGFNPAAGAFHNTREELKFRGAAGPAPDQAALIAGNELTDISVLQGAATGSRVSLTNVTVDRTDGSMFWVRDGDATIVVSVPGDMPTVRAGQHVNITGTIESNGAGNRIRASRIVVR